MAAIDRLNTKYFREVKILLAWCSNKRPSLLENITDFAFYEKEFRDYKEESYKSSLSYNERDYTRWELGKGKEHAIQKMIDHYKSFGYFDISMVHPEEEVDGIYATREALSNKDWFIGDVEVPIACFRPSQDRWLKWHCPLDFVRQYLKDNCGMKERWYYKLFFKY